VTNGHDNDLEAGMQRAERIIAALADNQDAIQSELRTLAKSQVLMSESLTKLAQAQADLVETQKHGDERLNALIDYFQRHLDEHSKGSN